MTSVTSMAVELENLQLCVSDFDSANILQLFRDYHRNYGYGSHPALKYAQWETLKEHLRKLTDLQHQVEDMAGGGKKAV